MVGLSEFIPSFPLAILMQVRMSVVPATLREEGKVGLETRNILSIDDYPPVRRGVPQLSVMQSMKDADTSPYHFPCQALRYQVHNEFEMVWLHRRNSPPSPGIRGEVIMWEIF